MPLVSLPAAPASRRKFVLNAAYLAGSCTPPAARRCGSRPAPLRRCRSGTGCPVPGGTGWTPRWAGTRSRTWPAHRPAPAPAPAGTPCRQPVQHEPVQRHLGQRHVADPVREPGAGQPGAAGHVDPAARGAEIGGVLGGSRTRPLAPGARRLGVFLVHAVRRGGVRQVGNPGQQRLPRCSASACSAAPSSSLAAAAARRVPRGWACPPGGPLLRGAQGLGALGQLTPPVVGGEQGIEVSAAPRRASADR